MNCIGYGRKQAESWGDFEAFRTKFVELKAAYDKMKGIKNKPNFIDVYTRVDNIVETLEQQRETKGFYKDKSI